MYEYGRFLLYNICQKYFEGNFYINLSWKCNQTALQRQHLTKLAKIKTS